MVVVNLFGVPGAGKSTGAAYIFSRLKLNGINAELITEFAKDKVWENNTEAFKNQAYLFGKQSYKMSRCKDKVDVIVTDSPLPLSVFYNTDEVLGEDFNKVVMNVFNSYDNLNYLLTRVKPYNAVGRHQTEDESDALKQPMIDLLNNRHIAYSERNGCVDGYDAIVSNILAYLDFRKLGYTKQEAEVLASASAITDRICTDITDADIERIADKFCEIGLPGEILTPEQTKKVLREYEKHNGREE